MEKRRTSTTHYFGYAITQNKEDFGFIRISKNASSYFASIKEYRLNKWVEIRDFEGRLYSGIRNPVDRFFSSIPETLTRLHAPNPNLDHVDVVISNDIWREIVNLSCENVLEFLERWISIIEDGFFDAHHEPQSYFIQDSSRRFYPDLSLFTLDKVQLALTQISSRENYPQVEKINVVNSGDRSKIKVSYINRLKKVNSKLKKDIQSVIHPENPIAKFSYSRGLSINDGRSEFYSQLLAYKDAKDIRDRISSLYAEDVELYESLKCDVLTSVS